MEVLIQLWCEQSSGRSKMIMVRYTTSYYQTHFIHLQLNNNNNKEFIYHYLSIGKPTSTFAVLRPKIQLG